ncbi:RsmB/NOP family class I SAM-dependent RNA methyltransferase [Herbiconiux sp. L3-i23]|uniref:RsmB/NOP family class I SAM-dependent RNA methyltransferase n=1 Tax=Herbiconiux sp. L3-i23 TaxID=2905871 RepID=UPI0020704394|nr:transcription antitermination factor NusB [Herbiconiux sp. L3-i23]BDI22771.1 rRNA cytosine-C5-methyltransferase [Herbiconiux sp. L3-i23]
MSPVQPARDLALAVIRAVNTDDAYANLLLPARLRRSGLGTADAALATELTYGTLRRSGYYDRIIELASGRPIAKIDPPVRDILRLGAHQLLSMRVAPHAAVNEAVQQAKASGKRSATGFVNGVLRSIARVDREEWQHRVLGDAADDADHLAVLHSHPRWVIDALRDVLELDDASSELIYLLEADNAPPKVGVVALPGLADRDADLGPLPHSEFSPLGAVLSGGDPFTVAAVRDGRARVQDEGSQLAALALSRARPIEAGERWLDMCAGPGGKAALLAAEAHAGGAHLTANEVVPARARLVRGALDALPGEPEVVEGDGRRYAAEPETFDRVLLDAPCTGLGALRRRPEARWRKQPADVEQLVPLQRELFDAAVAALKPGGVLAYVTCSPHVAETREVVADGLARHPRLRSLDTPAVLDEVTGGALSRAAAGDAVQLWPHRHGTDGMFIALLEKTA